MQRAQWFTLKVEPLRWSIRTRLEKEKKDSEPAGHEIPALIASWRGGPTRLKSGHGAFAPAQKIQHGRTYSAKPGNGPNLPTSGDGIRVEKEKSGRRVDHVPACFTSF